MACNYKSCHASQISHLGGSVFSIASQTSSAFSTLIPFFLFAHILQPLIIAVEENQTVLNDTPDSLGIEAVSSNVNCKYLIYCLFVLLATCN